MGMTTYYLEVNPMARILVVDDDPEIVRLLRRGLIYEGYTIDTAADGNQALSAARDNPPDLVILDVMMPGMNGIEVCRRLRQASSVPILLLTAKGAVTDKVAGLDSGADDYLVKPFDFNELVARVRALLRRRTEPGGDVLRFSNLTMDMAAHEVHWGEQPIELSSKEFDLLELFMRHPRQVLTRETLYDRIWGYDFGGESNILDVYIRYLRAKLEPFSAARLIQTVRGVGYVLKDS
jgi:two-component system, OmpR family, response regulator MprA